jgi:hypothetical protein
VNRDPTSLFFVVLPRLCAAKPQKRKILWGTHAQGGAALALGY